MGGGLALGRDLDPLGGEGADQVGPGQGAAGQHRRQRLQGPLAEAVVEAELEAPAPVAGREPGAEEGHQPAGVLGGHHVQGAAHRPGPDHGTVLVAGPPDRGLVHPGAAGPHGQPGGGKVLGLEPGDGPDQLGHVPGPPPGQALGPQPELAEPVVAGPGHRTGWAAPGRPPLSTRPERRPVNRPSSTTRSPARTTWRMPVVGTSGSR